MRFPAALVLGLTGLIGATGCTTQDDPTASPYKCLAKGGVGCFEMPDDIMYAVDPSGEVVAPSLGCGAYVAIDSPGPVMFSGTTVDADDAELAVDTVHLEASANVELTTPLFDVTSDDAGVWSTTVASMPSQAFLRVSKPGNLDLYYLYTRIDIGQAAQSLSFHTASRAQVAAVIESAGDQFLPGTSQLSGVAYDCAGNHLASVIANASPVSAKNGSRLFEAGVKTYYGPQSATPMLTRRTELHQTSGSGRFAIANLAPEKHYIQLWGFLTEDDRLREQFGLTLVAEVEIYTFNGEAGVIMPVYAR
jgi:hypothetical protein